MLRCSVPWRFSPRKRWAARAFELCKVQARALSLQEHYSMSILKKHDIPVPLGFVAKCSEEAEQIFEDNFKSSGAVLKAQVLAGGRGKGKFSSGLQGGVQVVNSKDEVRSISSKMIGHKLITKQTGAQGRPCNEIYVVEKLNISKEYYFAIMLDRSSSSPVLIASPMGGMNIEEVAEEHPECIFRHVVGKELTRSDALEFVKKIGFNDKASRAASIVQKLYECFTNTDSTMLEINPLSVASRENTNTDLFCMDVKLSIDDNADFRQEEIFSLRDYSQEEPLEVQAHSHNLNYIKLDGSIACIVNGAGLAMATMDMVKLCGGSPANFLDVGGTAQTEQVVEAFKVLIADRNTKIVFVNIFGGIVRCDIVAEGIISAMKTLNISIPVVVRLMGTQVDKAKSMITGSKLPTYFFDDFEGAARKAVELSQKVE